MKSIRTWINEKIILCIGYFVRGYFRNNSRKITFNINRQPHKALVITEKFSNRKIWDMHYDNNNGYLTDLLKIDDARISEVSYIPSGFEYHTWYLFNLFKQKNCRFYVEFGIRQGVSTILLANCADYHNGRLISIDPSDKYKDFVQWNINYYQLDHVWTRYSLDSINFRDIYKKEYGNQKIDCLFIDSAHSYSLKMKELDLWFELVKSNGGIIVFDDVIHCFDNNQAAINDFLEKSGYEYILCFDDDYYKENDQLTAMFYSDGNLRNFDDGVGRPFIQEKNPEEEISNIPTFPPKGQILINRQEVTKSFNGLIYTFRPQGTGLGILEKQCDI